MNAEVSHTPSTDGNQPFINGIDRYFTALKNNTSLLPAVPFIMGGDPDIGQTEKVATSLYKAGVRLMEIGMPFSDPTADGPVIQQAGVRALHAGATLKSVLECVRRIRLTCPKLTIILMGYYNPVRAFGEEAFARACAAAGVSGVILVDLPPEHDDVLMPHLEDNHVHFIRLLAPNTRDDRLKFILSRATGCVYHVAVAGVTGSKSAAYADLEKGIARIRKHSDIPVLTGFGVRKKADVNAVTRYADAAVIGSALVDAISKARDGSGAHTAGRFWDALK